MSTNVSVVIPAFNEGKAVEGVLKELTRILGECTEEFEIIIVDDGSSDDTAAAAYRAGARVVRHRNNRGYGAALKSGIIMAKYDIVAITDADGTYPAEYLPQMIKELEQADMVVGSRTGSAVHIPWIRKPAKRVLNWMANYLTGRRIPDLNSGLRVFRREVVLPYFPILPDQFSWTTTITLALLCDKYAVEYIPINYRRREGKSKIVPWDAGSFAVLILRTAMLYRPLRVFIPVAALCFLYGVIKLVIDLWVSGDPNISATATMGMLSALIITLIGMLGDAISTRLGRLNPNAVVSAKPQDFYEPSPVDSKS